MAEPEIVENFYGVYLLYNINPKYKGRTYIGYTRDPNRRIMQHNRGTWAGGAHRTSNKGPWKMVMIIHGFPNNISALRFEWAWQNPNKTTRLQHLDLKKMTRKETLFQFKLRVLSEMLRVGPWCRLPLTIRWLENDFREEFPIERKPPDHMTICQGPVKSLNTKKIKETNCIRTIECIMCSGYLKETEKLSCTNANCVLASHIICLADLFLSPGEYIPIDGYCPLCNTKLIWGDLIRKMNGCNRRTVNRDDDQDENDDDVVCTQDRVFVDNFEGDENDVLCVQDNIDDDENDVICTQDNIDGEENDVVCTQYNNDYDDENHVIFTKDNIDCDDKVICTSKSKDLDSDDDIVFKKDKVYDELPSWFLDCNENL